MTTNCDNSYSTFEYGTGVVYGSSSCSDTSIIKDIDTPARDLVHIYLTKEVIVNADYLNAQNYDIIAIKSSKVLTVRSILKPKNSLTSSRISLFVDHHEAGTKYSITFSGLKLRDGTNLQNISGTFIARDAKVNSMLAVLPNHFSKQLETSSLRHVLQALAEADDKIGAL